MSCTDEKREKQVWKQNINKTVWIMKKERLNESRINGKINQVYKFCAHKNCNAM